MSDTSDAAGSAYGKSPSDVDADAQIPPYSASTATTTGSALSTDSSSSFGRRLTLFFFLSLLSALLLATAPLSVSLPFSLVALLAPALAGCDCTRSRMKSAARDSAELCEEKDSRHMSAEKAHAWKEDSVQRQQRAEKDEVSARMEEQQALYAGSITQRLSAPSTEWAADSSVSGVYAGGRGGVELDSGSSSSAQPVSELTLVRSEEQLVIRKKRVVTSRLVVRKVVSTEMVILSVPVRRERLEVETVYTEVEEGEEEQEGVVADGQAAAATGYVRPLAPLPSDSDVSSPLALSPSARLSSAVSSSSDDVSSAHFHNYVGVDSKGQEVIELLLCEERPRIELDIAAVTRVRVTRTAFPSSQLVQTDLRKERIEYIPPQQPASARQAGDIITRVT